MGLSRRWRIMGILIYPTVTELHEDIGFFLVAALLTNMAVLQCYLPSLWSNLMHSQFKMILVEFHQTFLNLTKLSTKASPTSFKLSPFSVFDHTFNRFLEAFFFLQQCACVFIFHLLILLSDYRPVSSKTGVYNSSNCKGCLNHLCTWVRMRIICMIFICMWVLMSCM